MNTFNDLKQGFLKNFIIQVVTAILLLLLLLLLSIPVKSVLANITHGVEKILFPPTQQTVEVRNLIIGGLKETNELNTANITTKATIVASQKQKVSMFDFGDTNVVYEGVGTVRAGVDMTKLEAIEVDPKLHKIHVILPPPYITEVFLDVEKSNILARYKNWFGPNVEAELEEKAQKEALKKIKDEACDSRLLEVANENAKRLVEQILKKAQYREIIVDTQSHQPGACSSV